MNTLSFSQKALTSINSYLKRAETNALAIGIIFKNGEVGYFTSEGVSLLSRFDIGSISKTFTAQLILGLVNDEKISLGDTVDRYLPLSKGSYPTILQLLTHTAGYGHLTPAEITVPHLIGGRYIRKNLYRNVDRDDVLSALSRRNRTPKANKYGYSDFAYAILALIAEKVTSKPFYEILNDLIKDEYGLTNTEAYPTAPRVATYLGDKPIDAWDWDKENPYIAGGGVVSTIKDMIKYSSLQLKDKSERILMAQEVHLPSFSTKSNVGTCLGWHTYKRSDQLWHVGGVGAFRSSMIVNRHRRLAVIVLGNAKGGRSANVHYIAKLLYSELKKNKLSIR